MEEIFKVYPHNPPHLFRSNAVYMVTGAILHKHHLLMDDSRKNLFCQTLFERAELHGWQPEAWAVLGNHYHFVAQAPERASTLALLIKQIHSITARSLNQLDGTPGRQVWYNYWDSCITYETSYFARLHYVHLNPVKHGIVDKAENYPFCSYRWFLEQGGKEFQKQVMVQPIDRVNILDDF